MIVVLKLIWRIIAWIDFIVLTLLMYLLSFIPRQVFAPVYDRLFGTWCRTFIRALGVEVRLHEKYATSLPKQYIVIANHPSAFEDIGIPAFFSVYSVAKIELKDWFILGRISTAAGTVYLERENKASRAKAAETIADALQEGKNIAIYPQGGCFGRHISPDKPFLYGVFGISLATGIPIIPVFLQYEAQETFEWQDQSLVRKIFDFSTARNRQVNYYIFDPFWPENFASKEEYTAHAQEKFLQWQDKYLQ